MWPPIITYKEQLVIYGNTSILYYQWCGPLIVLLKHFAIYIKAKYGFPVKTAKVDESRVAKYSMLKSWIKYSKSLIVI